MRFMVSGLVNIETTVKIRDFPIPYYPIDYPFWGIKSTVSGVAYNVGKALKKLENEVELFSFIGKDSAGKRICTTIENEGISSELICKTLTETSETVVLVDKTGRRQIYCDLKDIQEKHIDQDILCDMLINTDIVVACNINFNRNLLKQAKKMGITIASDVHVINSINDEFNKEFMEYADILFLSDEQLPYKPESFIYDLKRRYGCEVITIGMGKKGALLYVKEDDKIYHLDAVKTNNVVNTVGAGDALFSAFLNFYSKGTHPLKALQLAEFFASRKIAFNGASEGFCEEKDILDMYREMERINICEVDIDSRGYNHD